MSDIPDVKLGIKNVTVQCSLYDFGDLEVDGLRITLMGIPNDSSLKLAKKSVTTWKHYGEFEIPSSVDELTVVVSADGAGEIGHISASVQDLVRLVEAERWKYLRTFFTQAVGGEPRLAVSFQVVILEPGTEREDISIDQLAMLQLSDDHSENADKLNLTADQFLETFEDTQDVGKILRAIGSYEEAAACLSADDPRFAGFLCDLGFALMKLYVVRGSVEDLQKGIRVLKMSVAVTQGDEDLPVYLNGLGLAFNLRFERIGDLADVSEAIQFLQRAIQLTPARDEDLPARLCNLVTSFLHRFEHTGVPDNISEAIQLQQRAIELTPDGDATLPMSLNKLGVAFLRRFENTADLADISESIQIQQRGVQLTSDGHASLPMWLSNLGTSFKTRSEHTGDLADASEAIQIQQRAVQLTPQGIQVFQASSLISEVHSEIQRAVQLTPDEHPELPMWLNLLGFSFIRRFERTGDPADISEAVQSQERAVQLTPDGHVDLPARLNNLGLSIVRYVQHTGFFEDISEAIQVLQRAVQLTPDGHPYLPVPLSTLGMAFLARFVYTGDLADISEAIQIQQRGVKLTRDGHPLLPGYLYNLGISFQSRFEHTKDLDDQDLGSALSNYHLSATSPFGSPRVRLLAAERWAKISALPQSSSSDLLKAHECIINLLSLITSLDNTVQRRYESLTNLSQLSIAASAAALSVGQPDKALEWLEQGRSIVWNQISQLRTPVEDLQVANPALAHRLSIVSAQLENAGSRTDPRGAGSYVSMDAKMSLQDEAHNHIKLAKEWDELLATIRKIPKFESFLLPRKCAYLVRGLPSDGPVIIINVHQDRCDALALMVGVDQPMHIPLPNFSYEHAMMLGNRLQNYLSHSGLRSRGASLDEDPLRAIRLASNISSIHLRGVLGELWTCIVQPILNAVNFSVPKNNAQLPRIWWCPTGPLAFLPIHASGIYDKGHGNGTPGNRLSDFAISSYIPTVTTLLNRFRSHNNTPDTGSSLLMVSQPNTPGLPSIRYVKDEIEKARKQLNAQAISPLLLDDREATVESVLQSMNSFTCIHLACHASQNLKNPLESGIHLHDGTLELSAITKKNLPYADFAFLSACQTSTGDDNLPEEAVHLAAGMLAAGYRSVVATMWSIFDIHAPRVAESFYENLLADNLKEGREKLSGIPAAQALHYAIQRLQEEVDNSPDPLLVWVPYIHVGI